MFIVKLITIDLLSVHKWYLLKKIIFHLFKFCIKVLWFHRTWYVVVFTKTNEVQHVPNTWLINKKICWFPYLQKDEKEVYFSMSQVANMISKHTAPNSNDGANYKVKSVAGPFGNKN